MPNWCNNTVEIAHKDPAKLKEVIDALNRGEFCHYAIPTPEDLKIVAGRVGDDTDPDQIELERKTAENIEKYGYGNWYDFQVAMWGTKWDVGGDGALDPAEIEPGQTEATVCFDSAWSPPIGAYEALVEKGFSIRAYYYEPGMAFAGVWDNGSDDFYEIGGMSSDDVADGIPSDLDECFGISECIREYEEENEEEPDEDVYNFVVEGAKAKGLVE
jgi:hypothetical protein